MAKINKDEVTSEDINIGVILGERIFSAKDVKGVSYRMLQYWHSQGFLLRTQAAGEWRKFDLYEMVWIQMIEEFRALGVEVKNIAESLKRAFVYNSSEMGFNETEFIWPGENSQTPDSASSTLSNPFYFMLALNLSIQMKCFLSMYVFKGGRCQSFVHTDFAGDGNYLDRVGQFAEGFINISITNIVAQILSTKDLPDFIELSLFTTDELVMIRFIREGLLRELKVKYISKNIYELKINLDLPLEEALRATFLILLSPYKKISYKGDGPKLFSITRRDKA